MVRHCEDRFTLDMSHGQTLRGRIHTEHVPWSDTARTDSHWTRPMVRHCEDGFTLDTSHGQTLRGRIHTGHVPWSDTARTDSHWTRPLVRHCEDGFTLDASCVAFLCQSTVSMSSSCPRIEGPPAGVMILVQLFCCVYQLAW